MKISTACVAALSVTGLASALPSWFEEDVISIAEDQQVPGKNPLTFCKPESERSDDIVKITNVDLTPNPPESCVFPSRPFRLSLICSCLFPSSRLLGSFSWNYKVTDRVLAVVELPSPSKPPALSTSRSSKAPTSKSSSSTA